MREQGRRHARRWLLLAACLAGGTAAGGTPPGGPMPAFDFSTTHAAKHLPGDYFEEQVRKKEQYVRWMTAQRELLAQLAPARPLSDEELFRDQVDLGFPGLEATRVALEKGDTASARKAFLAFFMERFAQQEPNMSAVEEPTGWTRKVTGWCEDYLAGRIGPLRSSKVYYTLASGQTFDFRTFDPVGMNNYDWNEINVWRVPVQFYILGYEMTGRTEYLSEGVRIANSWYDTYAGQGRANSRGLSFDAKGTFRQGNIGHAAIEFTSWEHWAVAQGRLRRMLELAPYVSRTDEPEELAIRTAKMAAEDLELLALRLPHYWGNFASYIGHDMCGLAVPFAFFKKAPAWFQLGLEAITRSYAADSFPDGATNDFSTSYVLAYLTPYAKVRGIVEKYGEQDRFTLDKEAFASEREKSFEWLLYTSMPDLSPATFNDSWRPRGIGDAAGLLRQLDWCGRDDFRWLATERKEGTPPRYASYPFRTHAPSWAGIYAMRSDWGPDAVYLAVDFGPYSFNDSHGHADYGSVNLFAYGNDLVIDPACQVYGHPLHEKIDKAPQTHNAVMIDGVGQHVGSTSGRPQVFEEPIRTWVTNAVFDAAWGTYEFPGGPAHSRLVWFVKPHYCLIVDTLVGKGKHKVRQNFTLAPFLKPASEGNAARTSEPDRANVLILPTDSRPAPVIVKGRTEPMYGGWACWGGDRIPSPAVVYAFEAEFPAGTETILYPTPPGVTATVAVTRETAEGGTGAALVTVETPAGTDRFVVARGEGRHTFPGESISFEGRVAFARCVAGRAISIGMVGGRSLRVAGLEITAEAPTDASLQFSDGRWGVGDGKGAIRLSRQE